MDGVVTGLEHHVRMNMVFTPPAIRKRPLTHLLLIAILLASLWEAASAARLLREDTWPPPTQIVRTLWSDLWNPENTQLGDQNRAMALSGHLVRTLQKWSTGFFIAVVIGVTIGAALGTSRTMFAIGHPVVSVLRAMPSAAIWPIAVLLIGLGFKSQLVTIVFGALWPPLLNTLNALTSLSPEVRDTMEFMQLSRTQKFFTQLRWALPGIFTGLELGCSIAFLLSVTVEVLDSSNGGIGWYMDFHRTTGENAPMYAGVLLTGLVGWGLNSVMHALRGTVLFWEKGVNQRRDLLIHRLAAVLPARRATAKLADKITDGRLRAIITAEDVSRELTVRFGQWRLELLYLGTPYFWPEGTERLNRPMAVQRDIRISAAYDGADERPILVAQSWLDRSAFTNDGQAELVAGKRTLGQIIREIDVGLTLQTADVEPCISEKLGLAFHTNGAVEAIKRIRTLARDGKCVGIVHEYVPVLIGSGRVFEG